MNADIATMIIPVTGLCKIFLGRCFLVGVGVYSVKWQVQFVEDWIVQTQDDDWLNDSAEQLQAEDALWGAANARHGDRFAVLAQAAREEIAAGATRPMFDEQSRTKYRE